jgi:hypothetical protein
MMEPLAASGQWELAAWVGVAVLAAQFVLIVFWVLFGTQGRGPSARSRNLQLEAERRAESLLQEVLSHQEGQGLEERGYLEIPSPNRAGRVYRVPKGRGMVSVFEDGRAVMSLCVQPVEWIPAGDIVLMHKLMIEANEEEYLRTANQFEPGYPYYLRWDRRTGRSA